MAIGLGMLTGNDLAVLDRDLAAAKGAGFSHAEVAPFSSHTILDGRPYLPRVEAIAEVLRRHDLGYTIHGPLDVNLMDEGHHDIQLAVARAAIEVTAALGSNLLVLHAGFTDARTAAHRLEDLMALERRALGVLAEEAEKAGVRIALENLPVMEHTFNEERRYNYSYDPLRLAAQVEAVGHPALGATIDVSHAYIAGTWRGADWQSALERLSACTIHYHVHDSFGRPPTLFSPDKRYDLAAGMGDLHLPVGWGDIDWDGLTKRLTLHPDTVIIFEIAPRFVTPEILAGAVRLGEAFARDMRAAERPVAAA